MRNTLAVVGAVDIHLATAIGAIEQAREGSCFAPAVRVASDISTDFLHKVKDLLVNDRLMGILKNCPFVLRDIMAFLVLEVLAGLEVDGTPLIAVQLMGVAYRMKMSRVEKRAAPAFDGRDEIVELEEEWA